MGLPSPVRGYGRHRPSDPCAAPSKQVSGTPPVFGSQPVAWADESAIVNIESIDAPARSFWHIRLPEGVATPLRPICPPNPSYAGDPFGSGPIWWVNPSPRRFEDTEYAIEPNRMIDSTLITRSTSVIASASVGGTP